ncbi:hypothetical protein CORT_0B08340 [Candida orthopsilosis Co 90-125]|uniref:Nudix hydrolase domain-containing protein n=1 Tax=Candida orthopsilosis (strain 90-125) TaxID=1136231 RepID=H8X028_CANO9|nr:hypothetical protein CORT_0B08340 [Candida orthopsilosis Co 90-125]CCG22539.1 hypothetical protein CORT_0B08340 [Candida orthopsilosis Co 90-125]
MTIVPSFTLGFIRCKENNKILMLNRNKTPWMGKWNGVGGKIHANETPLDCMIREAQEETGLMLSQFEPRGILTWEIYSKEEEESSKSNGSSKSGTVVERALKHANLASTGGLYLFTADITVEQFENYRTPMVYDDEGILCWKDLGWITFEFNLGVVDNIRANLSNIFESKEDDLFQLKYENTNLVGNEYIPGGAAQFFEKRE